MDHQVLFAFVLTLLAGLSTGIGSGIAFVCRSTNRKFLSVSLGFSAGVMIYVSLVEIMGEAREALVRELGILAPFGKDNPKPVFADRGVRIKRLMIMGKNRNVVKLSMVTANGAPATGIYFGNVEAFLLYIENKFGSNQLEAARNGVSSNIQLSIVYFPKINSFRGVDELQFEIQYYQ